jgi:RimJ/RimL family protein N-acetyltransferase
MTKLVPLSPEHVYSALSWVNDREVMRYFVDRQRDTTPDEEVKYINRMIESRTDEVYSIFDEEQYVGQCALNNITSKSASLFVVIRREFQNKGHAFSAVNQLLGLAWTERKLHKVWLSVRQQHVHAQRLYLALGFHFEGTLKDDYCIGGVYYDMVRMGVINPFF